MEKKRIYRDEHLPPVSLDQRKWCTSTCIKHKHLRALALIGIQFCTVALLQVFADGAYWSQRREAGNKEPHQEQHLVHITDAITSDATLPKEQIWQAFKRMEFFLSAPPVYLSPPPFSLPLAMHLLPLRRRWLDYHFGSKREGWQKSPWWQCIL